MVGTECYTILSSLEVNDSVLQAGDTIIELGQGISTNIAFSQV